MEPETPPQGPAIGALTRPPVFSSPAPSKKKWRFRDLGGPIVGGGGRTTTEVDVARRVGVRNQLSSVERHRMGSLCRGRAVGSTRRAKAAWTGACIGADICFRNARCRTVPPVARIGLTSPWTVARVELNIKEQRVEVFAEHGKPKSWPCVECGRACGLHDHEPER